MSALAGQLFAEASCRWVEFSLNEAPGIMIFRVWRWDGCERVVGRNWKFLRAESENDGREDGPRDGGGGGLVVAS